MIVSRMLQAGYFGYKYTTKPIVKDSLFRALTHFLPEGFNFSGHLGASFTQLH